MINVDLLYVGGILFVDAGALLGKVEWDRRIRLFEPTNRRALCKG